MSAEHNPFAAPRSDPRFSPADVESVRVRRRYLEHEAAIKLIGWLHILFGLFLLLSTVDVVWSLVDAYWLTSSNRIPVPENTTRVLTAVGLTLGGILLTWNGLALRELGPKARLVAIALYAAAWIACLFNLRLFVGLTVVAGYQVWCLCGAKGRAVCTPEYREVIRRTPNLATRGMLLMFATAALAVLLLALYAGTILWLT
jgi:hypothetical protein